MAPSLLGCLAACGGWGGGAEEEEELRRTAVERKGRFYSNGE